ncbi:MAG: hypothetical protein KF878_36215 [Planctomycetes bacterium]|nr:hypothetical protein [Planctomycetota bacterium]
MEEIAPEHVLERLRALVGVDLPEADVLFAFGRDFAYPAPDSADYLHVCYVERAATFTAAEWPEKVVEALTPRPEWVLFELHMGEGEPPHVVLIDVSGDPATSGWSTRVEIGHASRLPVRVLHPA